MTEQLADEVDPAAATDRDDAGARVRRGRRPRRWDRPPAPKDWRYVVGGAGRVLITVGLLMFGFVAYQLWGTGIETARAQNRLQDQFEAAIEAAGDATASPSTDRDVTAVSAVPTAVTTPDNAVPSTTSPATTPPPTTSPTTPPSGSTPVTVADQEIPPILPGQAIAKLEIPRMGKVDDSALYVLPGVDDATLHDGPGHYPDTPLPGQLGNAAIAGHRTTWGAPFGNIDALQPGDEITVTMVTGDRFVYAVTETLIVKPSDYWVIGTTDPAVAQLTLTSCHPKASASKRIVVRAVLVPQASAPAGTPTFYDLDDPTGDDAEAADPAGDSDDADQTVDSVSTAPATSPADQPVLTLPTEPTLPDPDGSGGVVSGPDALTAGWFHDSGAWPHVIGWGLLCLAIGIGASRLSRRFRSYLAGWAVAAVPFLLTLYFFYQNINRLLPPGF